MWTQIVVHHTASTDTDGAELDKIREWHKSGRGWSDIGYHWIVEKIDGEYRAVMARPMYRNGSHEPQANRNGIGIAFVGNFSKEDMQPGMIDAGSDLIAGLFRLAGRELPVRPHKDFKSTECPGNSFPLGILESQSREKFTNA